MKSFIDDMMIDSPDNIKKGKRNKNNKFNYSLTAKNI